jgi:hypothetical protein
VPAPQPKKEKPEKRSTPEKHPKMQSVEKLKNSGLAGIGLAGLRLKTGGVFLPLKVGAKVWADGKYTWTEIPACLRGGRYLQNAKKHQGHTAFEVVSSGLVVVAVTDRWGGGGNSGGGWKDKTITKKAFLAQGWTEVGKMKDTLLGWTAFTRQCKNGEMFDLCTEKYCAPVIITR